MKYKLGPLLLWLFLFYLFFSPLQDWAESGDFWIGFDFLRDGEMAVLVFTNLLAFSAYGLVAYTILYYHYPEHLGRALGFFAFSIPAVVFFRYFLQEILQQGLLGFGNYSDTYSLPAYFFDNIYYALVFTSVGVIFFLVQYSSYREARQSDLELAHQKTQLSFLRAQIQPHFLFNALNNIYSLVHSGSNRSLEAISRLSGLLRYALYEQGERVPLAKELAQLEDFIALERMRHSYELPIRKTIDLPDRDLLIPPFLIIPLMENAFKHGELRNPDRPIELTVQTGKADLIIQVCNATAEKQKADAGGVGLQNVEQRLALRYGNLHSFDLRKENGSFSVRLQIPLHLC